MQRRAVAIIQLTISLQQNTSVNRQSIILFVKIGINMMSDRILAQRQPLSSNSVLLCEQQQTIIYYLPCYVRFLVKQINNVDKEEMSASVSGALLFSFYYGDLSDSLLSQFIDSAADRAILLEFNQNESISLRQGEKITMKCNKKQKIIDFVVRQTFQTFVKGDLFLTPFVVLNLYIQVVAQTVHIKQQNSGKKVLIKFNCMDSDEVQILRSGEDLVFGMYRVAPHYFQAKYTNNRKYPFPEEGCNKADGEDNGHLQVIEDYRIKNHQYSHFRISIYQFPTMTILTVFVPIWILCAICELTFFQEKSLSSRLATVAVLVLAFVSFMPTINASIPPSPNIKLIDILIIINLSSIILLMVSSFDFYFDKQAGDSFDWRGSSLFKASIELNCFTFFVILLLYIIHKCFWQPKYKRKQSYDKKVYKSIKRNLWANRELDYELQSSKNISVHS